MTCYSCIYSAILELMIALFELYILKLLKRPVLFPWNKEAIVSFPTWWKDCLFLKTGWNIGCKNDPCISYNWTLKK